MRSCDWVDVIVFAATFAIGAPLMPTPTNSVPFSGCCGSGLSGSVGRNGGRASAAGNVSVAVAVCTGQTNVQVVGGSAGSILTLYRLAWLQPV